MLNDIKALLGITEDGFWIELPDHVKDAIDEAKSELNRGEVHTDEVISHISNNPFLYQYCGSKSIDKCVMLKQVSLFYQVEKTKRLDYYFLG